MRKSLKRAVAMLLAVLMLVPMLAMPASAHDSNYTLESGHPYNLLTALDRNKALDLVNNDSTNGTNIQIYASNWSDSQNFTIKKVVRKWGCDWYSITHTDSGKVLDVAGGSSASGTNVLLWPYHGGDNQLWTFEYTEDSGYSRGYRIRNALGTYLTVSGQTAGNGTDVRACSRDDRTNAQIWYLADVSVLNARLVDGYNWPVSNYVYIKAGTSKTVTVQFRGFGITDVDANIHPYYGNGLEASKAEWIESSVSWTQNDSGYVIGTAQLTLRPALFAGSQRTVTIILTGQSIDMETGEKRNETAPVLYLYVYTT